MSRQNQKPTGKKTNEPISCLATTPRPLMSSRSLAAIVDTWPKPLFALVKRFAKLPPQDEDDPLSVLGHLFAIDSLRDEPAALTALSTVVGELEVRPRYHEMFELIDRVFTIKHEVQEVCQDTAQHRVRARQCKFVRRR